MQTTDFLGNRWEYDCLGCAIADGSVRVPGGILRTTAGFVVHQDPLIPLPGFLVIAARRHVRALHELTEAEYREFAGLLEFTQQAIRQISAVRFLTLVQEEASNHFHLWFFPWTGELIERYGPPSLDKIRSIMSDHRRAPLETAEWIELQRSLEQVRLTLATRAENP